MTKGASYRKRPVKMDRPGLSAAACRAAVAVLAAEIAVPGAYGRPLRDRPLLGGLSAGADDAPHVVPPSRRTHGFKVHIDAATGKAGTYGMWIQFFHARDCISRAREGQAGNTLIRRKFFIFFRAGKKFLS